MKRTTKWGLLLALIPGLATGGGTTTDVLARGTTSWDGAGFAYPGGAAELTVVRISMPAGEVLPWHCHPVPLAGSITRGVLEVTKPNGESTTVRAGGGLIEVSGQWHRGRAVEDVEAIIVYAGAEGQPLTVSRESDPALAAACR
jgi:quercetin dioxygenase-like cupin family protein